jgi:ribonuclease-3
MLDVGPFETTIGIRFNNINLLKEALTHRSYLNERPNWPVPHNERLEYLGDAVLELAVTEKLFALFPEYPEGQLTVLRAALVNYQILGKIAAEIGMEQYMLMSKGERGDNQRAKEVILANAFEALVGAIYLDHGFATVSKFVEKFLIVHLDEILRTKSYRDPKSALQELVQERFRETPTYEVIAESGPAHQRLFTVGVHFDNSVVAKGTGSSKQEAELAAAKKAMEKYGGGE